jgi:hypothetical protein
MELTNDRPVPVRSVHADRPAALHAVPGLHPSAESEGSGTQRHRRSHDRRRRSVSYHPQILNIEENTGSIQPSSIPSRFLDEFPIMLQTLAHTLGTAEKDNKGRRFVSQLCPTACLSMINFLHYQTTFDGGWSLDFPLEIFFLRGRLFMLPFGIFSFGVIKVFSLIMKASEF